MKELSLIFLALALSLDSLSVGVLYGARGIRLPWAAILVTGLISGALVGLTMWLGRLAGTILAPATAQRLGGAILAGVGVWVIYQTLRTHIPDTPGALCTIRLRPLGLVIQILREPQAADIDRSGTISAGEAGLLGLALALDSVGAGFGAALAGFDPLRLPAFVAVACSGCLWLGSRLARILPFPREGRWSVVHGVALLLLGLYRMI
jgi:putative sporulation protein YtaF